MSIDAMKQALDLLGPEAPTCCGCEVEWNGAISVLRTAIQQAGAKTDGPVGYMNAGQLYELQQGRAPYGYIYPQSGVCADIEIFTHPAPGVPDVDFDLQELREIERAMDDFADCGETDVSDALLLRGVRAGFLECTHFHVANRGALQDAIDAAMLAAK